MELKENKHKDNQRDSFGWTRREENYIRSNSGVMSARSIARELGKSEFSVLLKAIELGVGL